MFSSTGFSKANAYRQVGVHSGIENASPHTLIQMLFDGLFQSLNAARGAIDRGDVEEKGQHISKAVRILQEGLVLGLDMEKGGELAANLRLLYDYSVGQLTKANLHSDVALVEEVIGVLQPVAQGWKEIAPRWTPLREEAEEMEMQLLDYYKAIEAKSAVMLQAALEQDWDAVVDCEKACGVLINELRIQSEQSGLTTVERKEKMRIMQRILRNDAQIRILAEPWLAQLDHWGKMPASVVH